MNLLKCPQEEGTEVYGWGERGRLRDGCSHIARTDREAMREWLVTVFRSEEDGYQPPGEDVSLDMVRERSPQQVTFMCPEIEMDRT